MKLNEIRAKHPSFTYKSHSYVLTAKGLEMSFEFVISRFTIHESTTTSQSSSDFSNKNEENIIFQPRIIIHQVTQEHLDKIPPALLHNWIFHIGLMEIPSYWKATTSPNIVISQKVLPPNGFLPEQVSWFKNLLLQGLGEFFYVNDIDFTQDDFVKFIVKNENKNKVKNENKDENKNDDLNTQSNLNSQTDSYSPPKSIPLSDIKDIKTDTTLHPKILVPLGGGKDSALTIGILDRNSIPYSTFLLKPHSPATEKIISASNSQKTITAQRTIDPKLLNLNQKGYLNGHTPFSAYLAFLSTFVGQLFGYDQIMLSNEHSANEGNTLFHGVMVNHQYSKSVDFERAFQDYVEKYVTNKNISTPRYFSFLRPLYEIQIAQLFAEYPQFHSNFRSCNVGQKKGVWCHDCPKCLFVFTMMFPFIETEKLTTQIFNRNLFEDPNLLETAKELVGITDKKPFECVGTHQESLAAFHLSIQKYEVPSGYKVLSGKKTLPLILDFISKEVLPQHPNIYNLKGTSAPEGIKQQTQQLLNSWNNDNTLDKNSESLLRTELISHKLSNLFENKSIAILGYGREGKSTHKFLQKYLKTNTTTSFHILDQKQGKDYLDDLDKFDVIFKSAGIPITLPELQQALSQNRDIIEGNKKIKKTILYSNTRLFFELCPGKIIGVTGTKGKSTTSSLIFHLLQETFAENNKQTQKYNTVLLGNIGEPPLSQLENISSQTYVVNELSSHQLAELKISPHIAVVQEITSEHLDYYTSSEAYRAAKSPIARYQKNTDFIIYNSKFEHTNDIAKLSHAKHLSYTDPLSIIEPIIDPSELPLIGEHNLQNIASAILAVQKVHQEITAKTNSTKKISKAIAQPSNLNASLSTALKSFQTLPHRMEKLTFLDNPDFDKKTGRLNGILYINDSLSTTPESAQAAIASFPKGSVILLAGGYERHQDYAELAKTILEYGVKKLVLFPDTGKRLWVEVVNLFKKIKVEGEINSENGNISQKNKIDNQNTSNIKLPKHIFINSTETPMKIAVKEAQDITQNGDVILLSPAAASFNTFKDYAERGDLFESEIEKYKVPSESKIHS